MFDYLIKNALVLDGSGIPGYNADVSIKGEKIAAVSTTPLRGEGERTIDGKGLALCPGFVDMHSHADVSIFTDPYAKSLAHQGVTLALMENCGYSPAPVDELVKERLEERLTEPIDITWSSFGEYLSVIDKAKFSVNVAPQIGHNTLRSYVMGRHTKKSTPSSTEMDEMRSLVEDAMKAGAFGMSSGLMYIPGCYSETEELIELCKIAGKWGGIYTTHMRGEANELLQSVMETIKIAEMAKVSTHIGHHRAECRVNWGLIRHTLEMMADSNRRGANTTCDFFPYLACGVSGGIPLPRWASPLYIPREKVMSMLKNPEIREKIKEQVRLGTRLGPEARSYEPVDSMDDVVVTNFPDHPESQGKSVAELARIKGIDDPYEFYLDIVMRVRVVAFNLWEEDIKTLVESPLAMIGTDSSFMDDVNQPNIHPRGYGSYPKILGRYVRDKKLISWEEAIMKLSSRPHSKLGIFDRGMIRPGFFADLVLVNQNTVIDRADYSGRVAYSKGIEYVFVNGEPIVYGGRHTEATPGKVLKGHSSVSNPQ